MFPNTYMQGCEKKYKGGGKVIYSDNICNAGNFCDFYNNKAVGGSLPKGFYICPGCSKDVVKDKFTLVKIEKLYERRDELLPTWRRI